MVVWKRVALGALAGVVLLPVLVHADAVVTVRGGGLLEVGTAAGQGDPEDGDCVTDDECDDGDDCTDDVCVAGSCSSTPIDGIDGAWCELDELYDFCEVTDAKVEVLLDKKIERAETLLDAAESAPTSKRQMRALKALRRVLRRLRGRIAKAVGRGRAPGTCSAAIEDTLARVEVLVQAGPTRP
jgi:hypothetical protein